MSALIGCTFVTVALALAQSDVKVQNTTAVSGIATGKVQGVGFRAMIQKQAIQYNLAGSAENNNNGSVRFVLQGLNDRIDQALKIIREGTKNSSDVNVSITAASLDPGLKTFTVVGWASESRQIPHHYDLVFNLRSDNTTIKKREVKAVRLNICKETVQGTDFGRCTKDND
jgi:acylphosphatase